MELQKKNRFRFLYIDNIRLFVIILVVIMHAAVTYSGLGSWYYTEGGELDTFSKVFFAFYQSFTQAFFMGLLFLVSGYFMPRSYDNKGFAKFLKDKWIRLGIPTLIYMLAIHPGIVYFIMDSQWDGPKPEFGSFYREYLSSFNFLRESGPLWFAFALLIFSFLYALVRLIMGKRKERKQAEMPGLRWQVLLILLISVCAFSIRLIQPIGTNILNFQLCFFSQYIIFFILGTQAYRNDWFSKIPYMAGKRWLLGGLIWGFLLFILVMVLGGALNDELDPFYGGMYWQSAAFSIWESAVAVAMSMGLLALFREKFNRQGRLVKVLSDNSFSVYMFHAPVLVFFTMVIRNMEAAPLAKFALSLFMTLPVCFMITHFIFRRVPLLKRVL